jgi:hypothetical protein
VPDRPRLGSWLRRLRGRHADFFLRADLRSLALYGALFSMTASRMAVPSSATMTAFVMARQAARRFDSRTFQPGRWPWCRA